MDCPIPPNNQAITGCSAQDLFPDVHVRVIAVGIGVPLYGEVGKQGRNACSELVSYMNAHNGDPGA